MKSMKISSRMHRTNLLLYLSHCFPRVLIGRFIVPNLHTVEICSNYISLFDVS